MKLFAKGKGEKGGQHQAPVFSPIDRIGLLSLLDQVVNGGQTGALELHEPRGNWVYVFQAGALTHASGGRVRGARQAFDLLWEFQSGECLFTPGPNPGLAGNLYIDKARLLDLLRRSQAALQGPSAPYIPPDQQRTSAPVPWQPGTPPGPGQMPAWQPQPGAPGQFAPQGWPPAGQPVGPPPGQPGMPPAPAWGAGGYPPQPGYPAAPYPGAPYPGGQPQGQPYPPQAYPQAPQPGYPAYPQQPMPPQVMPVQPPMAAQPPAAPPAPPAPPVPARSVTPPSFSVPPMAIPRKREALPTYQPPAAVPTPAAPEPARPAPPKDDLASLRASLVAQAAPVMQAPSGPAWGVRAAEGTVAPPASGDRKASGKGKAKGAKAGGRTAKRDSKLMAAIKIQLIKFLLWATERQYSPEDRWTLKDAFEISTMELRDQFIGAFSESLKGSKRRTRVDDVDDDSDNMAAGRMRGRGRRH
ncbi:MAG TPA: hypothetical protein VGR77_10475 [Candidatus Dormibacteraeota bacterium]|nr:hypothetical protein [Candidatus Dormibacteraeota bacterium]